MHFEVLVEDASGKIALQEILGKILAPPHTFRVISYRGVGRLPRGLRTVSEARHRILLAQLPRLLRGYGKSLGGISAAVVVVVDLDQKDCGKLKSELLDLHRRCDPAPRALFRIAIEEFEAWLLGDREAISCAYPRARTSDLDTYRQDSICGTWELLADAIHPGGAKKLKAEGWPAPGRAKCDWARKIAPHMEPERNESPSFQVFRSGLLRLAQEDAEV